MALAELLAGLQAEAAAETAALEAETRVEADRIVEAARAAARTYREEAARASEEELGREVERRRAHARLAAASALRDAREEDFRMFLGEVRERLDSLRASSRYPAVLRDLIRESSEALADATALRVDQRDEHLATDLLAELGLHLRVVTDLETAGGVELCSDDGHTARNTVEERLTNAEPTLRLLFGDAWRGDAWQGQARQVQARQGQAR